MRRHSCRMAYFLMPFCAHFLCLNESLFKVPLFSSRVLQRMRRRCVKHHSNKEPKLLLTCQDALLLIRDGKLEEAQRVLESILSDPSCADIEVDMHLGSHSVASSSGRFLNICRWTTAFSPAGIGSLSTELVHAGEQQWTAQSYATAQVRSSFNGATLHKWTELSEKCSVGFQP